MIRRVSRFHAITCAIVLGLLGACRGDTDPPGENVPLAQPARVLIVDLHGYIGCGVDADLIGQPIAEEIARVHDPIDAVVFSIDSGGGMLNRVGPLSDLIHERIRPRWRTMAWIERAESASALVAMSIPELWMPPDGLIGGAVGVERDPATGRWVALPTDEQEAIRYIAAACAARGGHDREVALSMTIGRTESDDPHSGAQVFTGDRAQEVGLVQNAGSLEAMLDEVFGEDGWEIDTAASAAIFARIEEAESLRERAVELQTRFDLAMQRAEGGNEYALAAADGYFDDLLALSVREDGPALRVVSFLGLFEWVDAALERMDAVSGESVP